MNLTKAEAKLLAKARHGRIAAEKAHGRGPKGGRVSHGAQATAALRGLVAKGLATNLKRTVTTLPEGGYTITVTCFTADLV
jgi:hypothetical protein